MEEKVKKTFRISRNSIEVIEKVKRERNIRTNEAALDYIIKRYDERDNDIESIVKAIDEVNRGYMQPLKYISTNSEVILDLLNTFLYVYDPRDEDVEDCISVEEMPHPFILSSEKKLKDKIAKSKMIKDNHKRKNKE